MAKKVYVLTQGEYSDYRIWGVYSTAEIAKGMGAFEGGGNVEEWELDAEVPLLRRGEKIYTLRMGWEDGAVEYVSEGSIFEAKSAPAKVERKSESEPRSAVFASVAAKSKEHAIKIVADARRRMIAEEL